MCAGYGWPTLVRRGLVPECGGWAGRRCAVATPAKAGGCARDPRQPRHRRRVGGHLALPRLRPGINITALPDTDREYRDTTQPARRSMGFSFSISILRSDHRQRQPRTKHPSQGWPSSASAGCRTISTDFRLHIEACGHAHDKSG